MTINLKLLLLGILLIFIFFKNNKNNKQTNIENKSKLALIVISCKKNKSLHKKFRNKDDTFVVIGNPNMTKLYNIEIKDNIKYLYVKTGDLYFELPSKVIMAIEAFTKMKELENYNYFYKIDDDCKIDYNKDKKPLLNFLSNQDYTGVNINYNLGVKVSENTKVYHKKYSYQSPNSYWSKNKYEGNYVNYLRGSNYVLSRNLTNKINKIWYYDNLLLLNTTEVFEDLMIGKVCFLLNINPSIIPKENRIVLDEFNNE